MLYFDYASTAPIDKEIYEESSTMAMQYWANPSSKHQLGKESSDFLQTIRKRAAKVLGVSPSQVIFNSGATEGNQFIFLSQINNLSTDSEILINQSEHPSVYENLTKLKNFGYTLKHIPNNNLGQVDIEILRKYLSTKTKLITIMWVNNETGSINPIKDLIQFCRDFSKKNNSRPIHFHVDATQTLGKLNLDNFASLDIDSAVFSGHKIGTTRGCGLLYLKNPKPSLLSGGGQEMGLRSGTENIMASVSMTLALEKYAKIEINNEVSSFFINEITKLGGLINPPNRALNNHNFINNIINFSFIPIPGEVLQRILSKNGLMCSTGSACKSNSKEFSSRILNAMSIPSQIAFSALRFSYQSNLSLKQANTALNILKTSLVELNFKK